jgi:hemolysin activation/secretion protein
MFKLTRLLEKELIALGVLGLLSLPLQHACAAELGDHSNSNEPVVPNYLLKHHTDAFELPPVPQPDERLPISQESTASIRRVVFRGNTVISTDKLDTVAAPYLQRKLSEADLEDLRQKLTRYYIDRGYINSGALLTKNAVNDDTVTYDLIEGHLKTIRLRGLGGLNEQYVVKRLVADEDAPLNVGYLRERFQLLLEDPLFERMNARLIPDSNLGEAVLDIDTVRARPYHLTIFANNYRPSSIGEKNFGLNGWMRNLTGYGDQLDLGFQGGASSFNDGRYYAAWRVPLNAGGTNLTLQIERGQSTVLEQPLQPLNIKSTLESTDIGLNQLFISDLHHKYTAGINQVERKNSTTLLGQAYSFIPGEMDGITKASTSRFWQEYSFRNERQAFVTRLTLSASKNNLQDLMGVPAGTVEISHRYSYWLAQGQYARQVLDNGAQVVLRATVQGSGKTMLSMDRISIGGVSTVRGYRENQLIRDTGKIVNIELHYPLAGPGQEWNLHVIPFYDQGMGKNQSERSDALSSTGMALRAQWKNLSFDFSIAHRLQHPDSTNSHKTLQDKGIHLQLGYSLF